MDGGVDGRGRFDEEVMEGESRGHGDGFEEGDADERRCAGAAPH